VLKEAFEQYPMVTFPNGETRKPETAPEIAVAMIQRYMEAIDGMLEKNADVGGPEEYYMEEALRLTREGVEHLEGFLRVQADLVAKAQDRENPEALKLAEVLDTIAHTLVLPGSENDRALKGE
jgi:hypothetical protein